MKSTVLFIVMIILSWHTLACQEKDKENKNLIFIEALGASYDGVGLGYGRYFRLSRLLKVSVRGGMALAGNRQAIAPFVGGSILLGKQSNLELGFNVLFQYEDIEPETIYDYSSIDENGLPDTIYIDKIEHKNFAHLLLGYRWQSKKSGFMFRIFITAPHQLNAWGYPSAGISLGRAF